MAEYIGSGTQPRQLTSEDVQEGLIFCLDKPLEWTSFNLVAKVKFPLQRRLRLKKLKVGHAGTLDPLATGVMLVCTGRATKLVEELQSGRKEYVATLCLGATTPSFDLEHEIDRTYPTEHITRELIEQVLPRFIGRIDQIPPAYSACKIKGKKAYDLARAGKEPQLKAKTLVIDEIELLDCSLPQITLRIVCSKGTYIRALARDIGQALESGAHLTALRRTRVGNITADQCLSTDEFQQWLDSALPRNASAETAEFPCNNPEEAPQLSKESPAGN
jgi:tRNA pseudouridine55 synthase